MRTFPSSGGNVATPTGNSDFIERLASNPLIEATGDLRGGNGGLTAVTATVRGRVALASDQLHRSLTLHVHSVADVLAAAERLPRHMKKMNALGRAAHVAQVVWNKQGGES